MTVFTGISRSYQPVHCCILIRFFSLCCLLWGSYEPLAFHKRCWWFLLNVYWIDAQAFQYLLGLENSSNRLFCDLAFMIGFFVVFIDVFVNIIVLLFAEIWVAKSEHQWRREIIPQCTGMYTSRRCMMSLSKRMYPFFTVSW